MTRWFRHYAGMMRDDKLVRAAVQSKQPVERVVWVWGAILESAAEVNDGGRYEIDAGEIAYFLRCDVADISCILGELENLGRVAGKVVVRWGDRQFESDTSRERQRRYRARKRVQGDARGQDSDVTLGESDVTITSPDGEVTPQETETETEGSKEPESVDFEEFWRAYPDREGADPKKPARLAYDRAIKRGATHALLLAAARAYRAQNPHKTRFIPRVTTWLNDDRWKGDEKSSASVPIAGTIGESDYVWLPNDDPRWREAADNFAKHNQGRKPSPNGAKNERGIGNYFHKKYLPISQATAAA